MKYYGKARGIVDLDLTVSQGEFFGFIGPNGAGKSTLGYTLMGSPAYKVTGGSIRFDGEDITELSADKRARMGMFLSFQTPLEVPGLSLEAFIRSAIRQKTGKPIKIFQFQKELEATMKLLNMDESFAERDLNVGLGMRVVRVSELKTYSPTMSVYVFDICPE